MYVKAFLIWQSLGNLVGIISFAWWRHEMVAVAAAVLPK